MEELVVGEVLGGEKVSLFYCVGIPVVLGFNNLWVVVCVCVVCVSLCVCRGVYVDHRCQECRGRG